MASSQRVALLAGVGTALLLLVNIGGYRPLTQHETYVAQTAREMLESGSWLRPTYYGHDRWEKPPLAYWLTMLSYSALGRSEVTARLPAVVSAALLAALLAGWTASRWGWRSGLAAGFALASSVWFLIHGRLAESDIHLTLAVTTAVLAYGGGGGRWSGGLWALATAASMLAKGPVGLLLIAVVLTGHLLVTRDPAGFRRLGSPWALTLLVVLTLGWPLAVASYYPDAVEVWWRETAGRVAADPHGKSRWWGYYPVSALWLTLPTTPAWLLLAGLAIRRLFSRTLVFRQRQVDALLWCWLLLPMVVLSLSAGKQEHYLLPALPAAAVFAGRGLSVALRRTRPFCPRGDIAAWIGRFVAISGISAAIIVSLFLAGQPAIYGRQQTVRWIDDQLNVGAGESSSRPLVALGHSIHWLCFYVDRSMVRIDSLEELLTRPDLAAAQVLATEREETGLRQHWQVQAWAVGPAEAGIDRGRRVVLATLGTETP